MKQQEFQLKTPFIPLMSLLKASGLAQTGGHAGILIEEEEVLVNGEVELRKRRKLVVGDEVRIQESDQSIIIVAAAAE
jgi:ribosome-associated protein